MVVAALFYGLLTARRCSAWRPAWPSRSASCRSTRLIQRDVPERIRASAFARSETLLQLAWVVGGFIGIALPLMPQLGLGRSAAVLVRWARVSCSAGVPPPAATAGEPGYSSSSSASARSTLAVGLAAFGSGCRPAR